MVRTAVLSNYAKVARLVGIDPDAMMRRAQLSPEVDGNPDARIPAEPVVKLLTDSAQQSGCASFGLLLAEHRTLSTLGLASLLLRHQPTIRAIMEASARVQNHFSDGMTLILEDDGDSAILRWSFLPEFDQPQWVEYTIAAAMHMLGEVTRGLWKPEIVHFMHLPPADVAQHKRLLRCELEYDAACNGISFPSEMLDAPNLLASPALAIHAERLLGLVPMAGAARSTADRARHAIYLLVHSGSASIERVGETLGMHPRALQRQLAREGWTFGKLLNETRRELAQRYLAGAHHSLATVSRLAGYATQSAFTRWFAAEFGLSPGAWRDRVLGRAERE